MDKRMDAAACGTELMLRMESPVARTKIVA
jgi:hypothetical protein